jgi:FHS family L-fucose permease-like MFS transporter
MLVALAVWFNRNRIKGEKHAHTSFVEGLALLSRPRFAFGPPASSSMSARKSRSAR